jgi:hypothetical protein
MVEEINMWKNFWFKDVTNYDHIIFGGRIKARYSFRWQRLFNVVIVLLIIGVFLYIYL